MPEEKESKILKALNEEGFEISGETEIDPNGSHESKLITTMGLIEAPIQKDLDEAFYHLKKDPATGEYSLRRYTLNS